MKPFVMWDFWRIAIIAERVSYRAFRIGKQWYLPIVGRLCVKVSGPPNTRLGYFED